MKRRSWIKLSIIVVCVLVAAMAMAGQGISAARPASSAADSWPMATPPLDFVRLTLQQGVDDYLGTQDTFINEWASDENHAGDWHLSVRTGGAQISLLRFDVSQVPAEADVALATLKVYAVRRSNDNSTELKAWMVNRNWEAGAATWTQATATEGWEQPGCNGVPADRSGAASEPAQLLAPNVWCTLDVTEMVRQWVASPETNRGLLLGSTGNVGVRYDLAGSEYPKASLRPILFVVYALRPTPTPTPTLPPILEIVKEDAKDPICITETLRYYISVSNKGDATAENVVVTDCIPLGTYFVAASSGGTYSDQMGAVVWALDSLPAGSREGLYIDLGLYDWIAKEGVVTNVVAVAADNASTATDYEWTAVVLPTPPPLQYRYLPFVAREAIYYP